MKQRVLLFLCWVLSSIFLDPSSTSLASCASAFVDRTVTTLHVSSIRFEKIYGPGGPLFDPRNWAQIVIEYAREIGMKVDKGAELRFVAKENEVFWYLLLPIVDSSHALIPLDQARSKLSRDMFLFSSRAERWLKRLPLVERRVSFELFKGMRLRPGEGVRGTAAIAARGYHHLGIRRGFPEREGGRSVTPVQIVNRREFMSYWSEQQVRERWIERLEIASVLFEKRTGESLFELAFERSDLFQHARELSDRDRTTFRKLFNRLRSREELLNFLVSLTIRVRDEILKEHDTYSMSVPYLDGLATLSVFKKWTARDETLKSVPILIDARMPSDAFVRDFAGNRFYDMSTIEAGHDPFGHFLQSIYLLDHSKRQRDFFRLSRALISQGNYTAFEQLVDRAFDHEFSPHGSNFFLDIGVVSELGLSY